MELKGRLISLLPFKRENCHEFYKSYIADQAMWDSDYIYDAQKVDRYYDRRVTDPARRIFGIVLNGKTIGEIQLKYIDFEKRCGTMSVHLQNDSVKGKGYGTEAEKLIVEYAFTVLKLDTVYADAVRRNTRSQHVLEKVGFEHTHDDETFYYYAYHRYDR